MFKKAVKTITIIGGGISSLSAGIYAQKNGFESVILEKHSVAGGSRALAQRLRRLHGFGFSV